MDYIRVSHLSKTIKKKKVLSDISLNIEKNTICGFVGPNGSGKTMLLRAIAGFLHVPSECVVKDDTITQGVIIENPAFINSFTGYENLEYLASIRDCITSDQIKAVMQKVQLDPNDSRKVKAYSLGMKQKLAIAQAIMEEPELLVLDEPTRGLDESGMSCVYSILKEQQERGATILIASHDKMEISLLCQHIFNLNDGKLVNAI